MEDHSHALTSEAIQMLVSSMTHSGDTQLTELEVERFLNALTRFSAGVPTGSTSNPRVNHND